MAHLYWTFDWNAKRAEAISEEGRYTIEGDDRSKWTAKFKKGSNKTDVIAKGGDKNVAVFDFLSEALRSCQRHSDRRSSESSGRLTATTPLPN